MVQLNEPMPQRLYEDADVVYYVRRGEGTVTLDGKSVDESRPARSSPCREARRTASSGAAIAR